MTILPVYTTITVPDATLWYQVELFKNMTGKDPVVGEMIYIVVAREEIAIDDMGPEHVYPIGVAGSITEINEQGYLLMHLDHRVRYDNVDGLGRDLTFEATALADKDDLDTANAQKRLQAMKDAYRQMAKEFEWGPMSEVFIRLWQTVGDIGAAISPWLDIPNDRVYALLETDSKQQRFNDLEAIIYEYTELARVRLRAQTEQKEAYQKQLKEQALRKQIEYMQQELDEMHPDELDGIRKLELQVQECGMNETARKEAVKVLNRLKSEGESGHEYGLLTDYLEFLVSLPWKKERFKRIHLDDAEKILDSDHFGLDKVKKRILEQIAVMQLRKKQSGSILLFVGAPGTGKTSIGQSIAKALKRKYIRVSLGGIKDEADIRGHRRTYVGAMPGRIMDGIQKSGVSNPVMILDEVDKLSQSFNGDPASALLEVLDPEQNNSFTDHYLNVPFDLSDVLFICTANSTETIPEPLLNRMEVIRFQGYTPLDKEEIAVRHLLPKARDAAGLKEEDLEVPDDVLRLIISDYTRESGVRGLKKRLDTLCRSAAVQLVRGQKPPICIQTGDLRSMLDMPPLKHGKVAESATPGVVTGLAWTAAGGEVLYIESRKIPGTGKRTVTGQLGDVMKESASIALSLARAYYPQASQGLDKEDLHLHVPDGATPKDGPSAGITMTTALASLFSGIPVPPTVAMTGEVSLQGQVNPIGGLPEKLMAAQRAGVEKVFIPADNVDDLTDVAKEVRDQLTIIPVHQAQEVLEQLNLL